MFVDLTLVAVAGAIGAITRYLTYLAVQTLIPTPRFPLATFLVNILGCLLIGIVMTLVQRSVPQDRILYLFGAVGFLGAFTTFSTFGLETLNLLEAGQTLWAAVNVIVQVAVGIGAVWVGRWVVHALLQTLH